MPERPWREKTPASSPDSLSVSQLCLLLPVVRYFCVTCIADSILRDRLRTLLKNFLLEIQNVLLKPDLCWRNGLSLSGTQNASGISQSFSLDLPSAPKCWSVCVCCHAVLEKIPVESVNWSTSGCKHSLILTFTEQQLAKSMSNFLWHTI